MSDPIPGSSDPFKPTYEQNPGAIQPERRLGRLGGRNMAILIALIAVILGIYVAFGGNKPATGPAPEAPAIEEVH